MPGPLLLVGCGKMGGALLRGWLTNGVADPDEVMVVEPGPDQAAEARSLGVDALDEVEDLDPDFHPRVVVLAVKPQAMEQVAPAYRRFAGPDTVFLSVAAGTNIDFFEHQYGSRAAIVRSMPNTPAAVGRGMLVACPNGNVSEELRGACHDLLAAVGEVAWIDDEALMDAVTGVSGSGPAYVFYMIECLAKAGEAVGLPAELALQLAKATVAGAGELAQTAGESPATLRENVTSPNGTTYAALQHLMAVDGLEPLMRRAVEAATRRSIELAGE